MVAVAAICSIGIFLQASDAQRILPGDAVRPVIPVMSETPNNDIIVFQITTSSLTCDNGVQHSVRIGEMESHHHPTIEWFGDKDIDSLYLVVTQPRGFNNDYITIFDMSLDESMTFFSGIGVVYGYNGYNGNNTPCVDEPEFFPVTIRGACDGSSFNITSITPRIYNLTASENRYHAFCMR